jgi:hypothetical protein
MTLGSPWTLAAVLAPVSVQDFSADYWGKRHLHVARREPDFYRDLVSLEEIERYMAGDDWFERNFIRVVGPGRGPDLPPPSMARLHERLLFGRAVMLRRMERFLDPASPTLSLVRDMEAVLQQPKASVSCYIAPEDASNLGPHEDETEIFTLQISGQKKWKLYPEGPGSPPSELVLEPGDLLYHPRGLLHDVSTMGGFSFSLTLVFETIKWDALLSTLVRRLASTAAFREALPAGCLLTGGNTAALRPAFDRCMEALRAEMSLITPEWIAGELASDLVFRMTCQPIPTMRTVLALDRVGLGTSVVRRDVPHHVLVREDAVTLVVPGNRRRFARTFERPLRETLAAPSSFRVGEIGLLSDADKIDLVKQLLSDGLLAIESDSPSAD